MDPFGSLIIAKALDGLAVRAQATAANIANANSPGYRPLRVNFEQELRSAAAAGQAAVAQVTPRVERAQVSELRLDLELATASQTAMRYSALLDMLGRGLAISRLVVSGGR